MKEKITPVVSMANIVKGLNGGPGGFLRSFKGESLESVTELILPENCCRFIEKYPFRMLPNVRRVVLSEGITGIMSEAFSACPHLAEIVLPSTLTEIGEEAFMGCTELKKITYNGSDVPNLLPPSLTMIGMDAFRDCRSLTSLTFGERLACIEGAAFFDSGIKSFRFLGISSLSSIAYNAFAGCYDAQFFLPESCNKPSIPYTPEMGECALPESYIQRVKGSPLDLQAQNLVFSYPDTEKNADLTVNSDFNVIEFLDLLSTVNSFIEKDGVLVGLVVRTRGNTSTVPVLVGRYLHTGASVSYYHNGDNNGAGYKGDDDDNSVSTPEYSRLQYRV